VLHATETPGFGMAPNQKVEEVCGVFAHDASLSDAVSRLTDAGFDRARMVLTAHAQHISAAPSVAATENPKPEDDTRQLRTLHSSMAASAAAMAGAATVVATGGAALAAVAVAAGAGVVAGGGMLAATNASDNLRSEARDEAASRGLLSLVVGVSNPHEKALAEQAMREAGATEITAQHRHEAAVSGQSSLS